MSTSWLAPASEERVSASEHEEAFGLGPAARLSLISHVVFAVVVLLAGWIFPSEPKPYIPSLRVDLVGLPDVLKKDLDQLQGTVPPQESGKDKPQPTEPVAEPLAPKTQAKKTEVKEKAAPDEMVLKPKQETAKEREKRMKSALARIKALNKIAVPEEKNESVNERPQALIKGNQISRGSSLSGEARENSESGYYDQVLGAVRSNWSLPVWLARQKLSARVRVLIDAAGNVTSIQFTQASGNAAFDAQVKRSILESQPLPRPPENLRGSVLRNGVLLGFPL